MELLANDVEENCADEESIPSDDTTPQLSLSASHTVTFKCIGASRSVDYQDALKQVAELQKNGIETPVNIFCETINPYDARAIAFRCKLKEKWIR